MPRATIDVDETIRFDLKTLPDAYVVLRRMPYGKYMHRQEMALQMKIEGGGSSESSGSFAMANRKVTEFEFRECIADHNLTDHNDAPLDFTKPFTLDMLDSRIGDEISTYIGQLLQFGEQASLGNLNGASERQSLEVVKPTEK